MNEVRDLIWHYRKWIVFFGFALGFYWLVKYVVPFFWPYLVAGAALMVPFALAVFFSIFLEPLVRFFSGRLRLQRGVATGLAMLTFFGGIALVFSLVVGRLVYELIRLSKLLPHYTENLVGTFNVLLNKGTAFWQQTNLLVQGLSPEIRSGLSDYLKAVAGALEKGASGVLTSLLGAVQNIPGGLTSFLTILLITLLATYFISKDRQAVTEFWIRVIPPPYGRKFISIGVEVSEAFGKYLRAQLILLTITMVVSITGLSVIGAEYALTIGLLVGFMDVIPVLGPGSVYVPWILWAYFSGDTIMAIKLLVLYALVVVLRQVLETKVVADSLGIHPLATLISMYLGLKLIGFAGLFMGPILVIAVQAVVKAGVIKIKY
ncbi:MAG: sporulation integral membrane protein YtvI [Firmicutes bacterium]|nr:sporulation integral membrane protein YtvI [Bacillota bacterium]